MLEKVIKKVLARIEKSQAETNLHNYALIGAMAVARWGIPRATADFDFFLSLGDAEISTISASLNATYRQGTIGDPLNAVITFNEKDSLGELPVKLIVFPKKWDELLSECARNFRRR